MCPSQQGAQPEISVGVAKNNQVSALKYLMPLVFEASFMKRAFVWRLFPEHCVQI